MSTAETIISLVGSICSIAGLGITLWVLTSVQQIRQSFLLQARLPDLSRKIQAHAANLNKLLADYPKNASEIDVEIQKCTATLNNLLPKMKNEQATSVSNLLKQIRAIPVSGAPPMEQIRRVQLALVRLEQELANLSQDKKWSHQQ